MAMSVDDAQTKTIVLGINEAGPDKVVANEHLRIFSYDLTRDEEGSPR